MPLKAPPPPPPPIVDMMNSEGGLDRTIKEEDQEIETESGEGWGKEGRSKTTDKKR